MFDEDGSFSLISTLPDVETIYTPREESSIRSDSACSLDDDHGGDRWSSCSTSLTPSVVYHEFAHGRRYHGHMSGKYPLPNDSVEQQREETNHLLMLELTVCTEPPPRRYRTVLGSNAERCVIRKVICFIRISETTRRRSLTSALAQVSKRAA
jgi:hypothetical protein